MQHNGKKSGGRMFATGVASMIVMILVFLLTGDSGG